MAKSTTSGWDGIDAKIRQATARGILAATEEVRNEAVSMITNSPPIGRTYVRNGVSHTASAPGNSPRSDTGNLLGQIRTEYAEDGLTGYVVSAADYARHLEFGTKDMEPRPYMRPALQSKSKEIEKIISREISKALK